MNNNNNNQKLKKTDWNRVSNDDLLAKIARQEQTIRLLCKKMLQR